MFTSLHIGIQFSRPYEIFPDARGYEETSQSALIIQNLIYVSFTLSLKGMEELLKILQTSK